MILQNLAKSIVKTYQMILKEKFMNQTRCLFSREKNVELPPVPFDPHSPFHTSKVTDIPVMLQYL